MKRFITLLMLFAFMFSANGFAQQNLRLKKVESNNKLKPTVKYAAYYDHSKPLREMIEENKFNAPKDKTFTEINKENEYNPKLTKGKGKTAPDQLAQIQRAFMANKGAKAETLILNDSFDGGANSDNSSLIMPPDTQGDVSPSYYMQAVNNVTRIYDKSGNLLQGPFPTSDFWSGFGIFDQTNDGDAIILWDENAGTNGRWLVSQFAVPASDGKYYELVAISQTDDPRGAYNRYAFEYQYMPDYPKLAVWPDGYYAGFNAFDASNNYSSEGIYASVYERDQMIAGNAARMVNFQDVNEFALFPADADDFTNIPVGAPCYFINDQVATYTNNNEVYIWQFHVDWNNTANSTFGNKQTITVSNYGFFGQTNGDGDTQAEQPGTTDKLDMLHYRTMYRAYYRPFADHNSLLMCRTVDPANDGADADEAGIRWYEFRNTGTGTWSTYQEGTYAPGDGKWRWMPSIAMNANGDIAIGYSISDNSSTYPSLAAVARYSTDPLNVMSTNEKILYAGGASQDAGSSYTRWGDYSMLSVDPSDNYSFWFTSEYTTGGWNWRTRITHFSLPVLNPPTVTGVSPSSLYEDRGKQLTITGSDLLSATFDLGGIAGTVVSNDGSTAVVDFPAGNYANGTLTVTNSSGSDNSQSVTINIRNTIPVVSGAGVTDDNHPTIQSALDGLFAWYGTTSFGAGDLPGAKIINVSTGTYAEEVTVNSTLGTDATNTLTIQNNSGDVVIVNASGNDYGFNLGTLDYVTLKGFTVHGATITNIYAQGNNVTIQYNKSYGAVGDNSGYGLADGSGIKVETGTPFTITNNLCYGNAQYGIHVNSGSNTIKNNTCDDNGSLVSPSTGKEVFNDPFANLNNWVAGNWGLWSGLSGSPSGDPFTGVEGNGAYQNITSNAIDVTGYNNLTISCYYRSYNNNLEPSDDIIGEYSFDNSTWTQFFSASNDVNTWTQASVSGVNPSTNSLYIRFRADVDAGEYWFIDDVVVTGDENFTAYNEGSGLYVESGASNVVENNILVAKTGNNSYYTLKSETGITVSSQYNTYYTTNTNLFDYNGTQDNTGPMGTGDITSDPAFIGSGDYHIFSTNDSYHGGEWPPTTATSGTWTTDASDSPALDAGNPADSYANEPASGGRINQGAYGNTVQASKTVSCSYPSTQASNFNATPSTTSINVSWTRGNGDAVIVLAKDGSAVDSDPVDGTSYTANAAFGSGTQIGTGNYVVYDGTGTSVNVTGLTSGNTYYFAIYEYSSTGNCYLTPALTGNSTTTVVTFDWTGATNNDWFNTGNWSSGVVPGSGDDVTIANVTNQPIINNGISNIAQCNNMTIDAGADITVDVNGYITVNGSITNNAGTSGIIINSDDTGTGSLIQNTSGGVDATVNCRLSSAGRQWHLFASPITSAPQSVLPSTSNFYEYDESTDDYWTGTTYDAGSVSGWTAPAGNLAVGKGYAYNYFATTLTYTGQLNDNTSTSSLNITYTDNGGTAPNGSDYDDFDGWVLLGNPYTSAIDWDDASVAHAAANLNDAIYTYDDTNLHNYTSYVGGTGTNGGTRYIPAMQGFFVKATANGTLNIGANARVHNAQGFWKSNYTTPDNFLRLKITSENAYTDETIVRFSDNATSGMDDGFDAYKLFTWENYVPQIYTNAEGSTDYSINTLKTFAENSVTIPLKAIQTGDTYTISVTEFNFNEYNVYLKDNLKNETLEIGLNDVLNLTSDESDANGRYELIFEKSASGIVLAETSKVMIYPNPTKGLFYLTVGNNHSDYTVNVSNITGQTIYNNKFFGNTSKTINLSNQSSGIYFVTIKFADNSKITKKIVIE